MSRTPETPSAPPEHKCWTSADAANRQSEWTRVLTTAELDDIRRLADAGADLLAEPTPVSPTLQTLADAVRLDLLDGFGFVLLRGIDPDEFDPADLAAAYYRFGRLIGVPRSQNAAGHLLGHVRDVGADVTDPKTRIYQTNQRQTFHTDSTDAVGLLCLQTAKSGGQSLLASATTIYAECVARDPALAARLFAPVATDRRGEQPPGEKPWFEVPVLSWFDEHLTVLYQRQYIEAARRFADAPVPDETHTAALDLFDEVANDPDIHLSMQLEPGDIQFVHNHSMLHDRTGFVDHPEPANRRHLLRLWLSLPADRQLPPVFRQRYGPIEVGNRGGIVVDGTILHVPLTPE